MKRSRIKSPRRVVQRWLVANGTRGGYRANGGRKRVPELKRTFVAHERRASLSSTTPVHVTLRMVEGIPRLRRPRTMRWIRRCIQLGHRDGFRVVHYSVLNNHLHMVVEAQDNRALARGMQGLKVRIARRLNQLFARRGEVFRERYHARVLRSPREVRSAISYVLLNRRKHAARGGRRLAPGWVDPFSSATSFDGWAGKTWTDAVDVGQEVAAAPTCWLLRSAWRRGGGLDTDEVPLRWSS